MDLGAVVVVCAGRTQAASREQKLRYVCRQRLVLAEGVAKPALKSKVKQTKGQTATRFIWQHLAT